MTRTEPATSASIPRGGPIPPLVPPLPPPSTTWPEVLWPRVRIVRDDSRACPFLLQQRWWWFPFWFEVSCFTNVESANTAFDDLIGPPKKPDAVVIREG